MTFQEMKEKVESLKIQKAKLEAQKEMIEDTWMKTYGTKNVSEIRKIAEEKKSEADKLAKEFRELFSKAESILSGI